MRMICRLNNTVTLTSVLDILSELFACIAVYVPCIPLVYVHLTGSQPRNTGAGHTMTCGPHIPGGCVACCITTTPVPGGPCSSDSGFMTAVAMAWNCDLSRRNCPCCPSIPSASLCRRNAAVAASSGRPEGSTLWHSSIAMSGIHPAASRAKTEQS